MKEENKKTVALNDDDLDSVNGGQIKLPTQAFISATRNIVSEPVIEKGRPTPTLNQPDLPEETGRPTPTLKQ